MAKVLFLLKERFSYWNDSYCTLSSGLRNSAGFIDEMLRAAGVESKLVECHDNNDIDREVTAFRPTHVIIEALWCVPEKFEVLARLHPEVAWIIRNHSAFAFLAQEGIGVDWFLRYLEYPNVYISCNELQTNYDFLSLVAETVGERSRQYLEDHVVYLPNYYPPEVREYPRERTEEINIGCFGAIRPLKNTLLQAIAAIKFTKEVGRSLRFHVNSGRLENNGEPCLKSLRALFTHHPTHILVEHPWMPHDEFHKLCGEMDIGMQVSFSETFNIVAADFVTANTPIVVSSEVRWAHGSYQADPNSSDSIVSILRRIYNDPGLSVRVNLSGLRAYVENSKRIWLYDIAGM